MQNKPLSINQVGIESILWFADDPARLNADDHEDGQRYVPGISVPGVADLEAPFNVPILGDEESVSLSIDWPRFDLAFPTLYRRATLTYLLPDFKVTRGDALNESTMEDQVDADLDDDAADEAFVDYSGDFGAFLQVRAEEQSVLAEDDKDMRPATTGSAGLFVFETGHERDAIVDILGRHYASPAEIVAAARGVGKIITL